ncbi:hemin uptake protein HemP [Undibacterium rugosum]|uniref:Hemin uptake protein HemP n=1 Tax=Undibacterium rugosum TaxID=2762291 RepID=A0A923I4I3_9BURK|nr:hemin uptake protein HemP [Undibacterium rugosum]MBC3935934.1 hemin uptake protein HemP [Undibacterium rugosum]MBR7778732.1 hemin uptake protein HemP [Undibacterium rugosum]
MAEFDTTNPLAPALPAKAQSVHGKPVPRLKSQELMQQSRELEIDHEGRIYRLRVTQLNKLILTA